jgi:hypothetical protein
MYGTFAVSDNGDFTYNVSIRDSYDTLTETALFSYTDIDGEKAIGKVIINILVGENAC